MNKVYPCPGYCAKVLQKLTEVPGKGMEIVQNLQKCRDEYLSFAELTEVPGIVARAYRTHRSCGQV